MNPTNPDDENLKSQLRSALEPLGLMPIDRLQTPVKPTVALRRGTVRPPTEGVELLSLVRGPTGVLRWEIGADISAPSGPARRAGRAALPAGQVVQQFAYEKLPPNEIYKSLAKLDDHLTPYRGLRRWNPATGFLESFSEKQAAEKSVLLFIHGTFSNCDSNFTEIRAAPNDAGNKFLEKADEKYDLILTFDHPTIGVSPIMNAFDLAALLRPFPKKLDIICHSRGGLVARWFMEGFATDDLRQGASLIMVATSIGGTSLVAPASLRSAMDYLANVGDVLGKLGALCSAHPFLTVAGAITRVLTSLTHFTAKAPIFDAAIAMIPGLQAQSRAGNNPELVRLQQNTGACINQSGVRFYAVLADFQPTDPGWNFLQYFSKPMQRFANWGADLVFQGPNDLVVDCSSMDELASAGELDGAQKITDVLNYGKNSTVHHTNYFRQERTLDYFGKSLRL
jgi:pimeloyl-ACP methyl ester carboxylesterase